MKNLIEELKKSAYYNRPKQPKPSRQFEELEASSLFCPKCKAAVPVRKKLLLVLPEGEKFEYLCTQCGSSVGSKTSKEDTPMNFVIK
jgi:DNA-directed RNA polymerase subunit RPC12/RpoP